MIRPICLAVLVGWTAASVPASGQTPQDGATAHLRERQASRATQPATQGVDEIARLRKLVESLQAQVKAMREENQALRVAAAKNPPAKPPRAVKADDDGPGLYRLTYYTANGGDELPYEVAANSRAAAVKIAVGQNMKLKTITDLNGNEHAIIEKVRELTPQERGE